MIKTTFGKILSYKSTRLNSFLSVHLLFLLEPNITDALLDFIPIFISSGSISSFSKNFFVSSFPTAIPIKQPLLGLTKSFATEMAKKNIRANLVNPGFIKTSYFKNFKKKKKSV